MRRTNGRGVARIDDRRVISGIIHVIKSGVVALVSRRRAKTLELEANCNVIAAQRDTALLSQR